MEFWKLICDSHINHNVHGEIARLTSAAVSGDPVSLAIQDFDIRYFLVGLNETRIRKQTTTFTCSP